MAILLAPYLSGFPFKLVGQGWAPSLRTLARSSELSSMAVFPATKKFHLAKKTFKA